MIAHLVVAGTPVPQGSKRVVPVGRRHVAIDANDKVLKPWRAAVASEAREAMGEHEPMLGPVRVECSFYFTRPLAHYRTGKRAGELREGAPVHRTAAPDLDKLVRALLDGLTGIVFRDDAQVVDLIARKCYGPAHVVVTVTDGGLL